MEEINDRDLELMFSFVFGWQGYSLDEMRFLLTEFLKSEKLTAKEVISMIVGEYEYLNFRL